MEQNFLKCYLAERRKVCIVFGLFCLVFLCVFLLYHIPAGAVVYPSLLCALLGFLFLYFDFYKVRKRHKRLQELEELSAELIRDFPEAGTVEGADYQRLVRKLCKEQKELQTEMSVRYLDMIDYYTMWVHQIKTPIASMHLHLQKEDSEFARAVAEDLFRVEQYVEMVLCYLRLGSDSTDYMIREYDLDGIIKQAVKKFARQFIRRKLTLVYQPLHIKVLTDEKWLQFVIEQVLSNALKYTETGTITIEVERKTEKPSAFGKESESEQAIVLCIRDTGIGIAPEDLPRIFEKGYTGYNGRGDKKASGIGLYLCRRICGSLGHAITANSSVESGTVIRIRLDRKRLEVE